MTAKVGDMTKNALQTHRQKWNKSAHSITPIDKEQVRKAISVAYSIVKLPPPQKIIYLDSPLSGLIAASLLRSSYKSVYGRVVLKPVDFMARRFWSKVQEGGNADWWKTIARAMKQSQVSYTASLVGPIRWQIDLQLQSGCGHNTFDNQQVFSIDRWTSIVSSIQEQLPRKDHGVFQDLRNNESAIYSVLETAMNSKNYSCSYGGHDVDRLEFLDFGNSAGVKVPDLKGLVLMARRAGWWWPFDKICIVTNRPLVLYVDRDGRLHNDNGTALEYSDGFCVYARHGSSVPKRVIDFSLDRNTDAIDMERNITVRNHMIQLYGMENYVRDTGAVMVHEDETGQLFRKAVQGYEPLVLVRVKNSSTEPDGTYKHYFLRVPPSIRTAREAVAWTFGLDPGQYRPGVET